MSDSEKLEQILAHSSVLWKAGELAGKSIERIETGYAALNAILPGQGWPVGGLMEFIMPAWGLGELALIMPLIKTLSRQSFWVIWIAPPHIPYAPHLLQAAVDLERVLVISEQADETECLWAMEKLLRANACGLVMAWPGKISHQQMRRLQLAAEAGRTLGIIFQMQEKKTSAAAFRLRLQAIEHGVQVEVIKARGGSRHQKADIYFTDKS
ncbi:MAG: translesion DNA synthesis-associated protein ImuA [Gammaproteobacteria bacterium]|nr:translesion DNA synthesis-associated protein ImuA [Gammaproteobacteria bacterium]